MANQSALFPIYSCDVGNERVKTACVDMLSQTERNGNISSNVRVSSIPNICLSITDRLSIA